VNDYLVGKKNDIAEDALLTVSGEHWLFSVNGIAVMSVIYSHEDDSDATYWTDDESLIDRAHKAFGRVLEIMYGHEVSNCE